MGHPFSGHRCGPDNGNYGRLVLLLPVSACSQSGGWGNWSCVVLSPWASAPAGTQPRLIPGHSKHSSEGTGPFSTLDHGGAGWMQSQSPLDAHSPGLVTKAT